MAKKRTINEYRQTKEHYNPPHSHDKVLESKHVHKFTSDESNTCYDSAQRS